MSEREIIERLEWLDHKLNRVQKDLEQQLRRIEAQIAQLVQALQRRR